MAVDHPADVAVFVDERFARQAPELAVAGDEDAATDRARRGTRPAPTSPRSCSASTVATSIRSRAADTRASRRSTSSTSISGAEIPADVPTWLVAQGWIYPTDSSINVAIGQGAARPAARACRSRPQDATGRWVMVAPDLGFPAGKNKTHPDRFVDGRARGRRARAAAAAADQPRDLLGRAGGGRRASGDADQDDEDRAGGGRAAISADSRRPSARAAISRRCRSTIDSPTRHQRWRDLVGFYTRFGDVRELVARVDDRYVIMNAGDELRLSFRCARRAAGRLEVRDFVLIGDGWEKDGDYNTSYSKTVLPLPQHGRPEYVLMSAIDRRRSGVSPAPVGLADIPHPVRLARTVSRRTLARTEAGPAMNTVTRQRVLWVIWAVVLVGSLRRCRC